MKYFAQLSSPRLVGLEVELLHALVFAASLVGSLSSCGHRRVDL